MGSCVSAVLVAEDGATRRAEARCGGSRETGGSGLGLAIVHALVHTHGATVTASNVPGAGTTVTVRIRMRFRGSVVGISRSFRFQLRSIRWPMMSGAVMA